MLLALLAMLVVFLALNLVRTKSPRAYRHIMWATAACAATAVLSAAINTILT